MRFHFKLSEIMRIIRFFILLLLMPCLLKGQAKFESIRKQLTKNKTYEYVYNFENNYARVRTFNGKMGLIDSTGNLIIKPSYQSINNRKELKNLFEVAIVSNKKFKRGYIDLKENIKIPIEYDDVFYLGDGLIRVSKNNKTGVLDTLNKIILPLNFDFIMESDGILFVQTNNTIDIFDARGKQLTNFQAEDITYFKDKRSIVTLQNKATFIIDDNGNVILNSLKNHKFENIIDTESYIIFNTITKKKGVINSLGQYEIECKYDEISPSNLIYVVRNNEKSGFINKKDSVLKPLVYNHIFSVFYKDTIQFQNQYFVHKGDLQGVINPFLEKEIIPISYKYIDHLSNYYITANLDNKNGMFSSNGTIIIPEDYNFYNVSSNKIFAEKKSKKYLLTIEDSSYRETEIFVDEFVKEKFNFGGFSKSNYQIFKKENKIGVISNKNKIVIPSEFDFITEIYSTGEFIVQKNKKYGIVSGGNQVILELKYDNFKIIKEVVKFGIKNQKATKFYSVDFSKEFTE
ncbi:WG repeat-containing protein [Flavobacterium sp. MDT1-60]|uniref:WG repeat-containing protein n=1 Tax=Flavobacterium sp. MDT1-60 TaxID=1979344 RepID=UPI00177D7FBD|nr:WG repeat-containing protein [Flavobacterium sp. MDT1-60]QOG01535.1 WG repeat-containing protein [Flavobacterium sp. MDT1-60]